MRLLPLLCVALLAAGCYDSRFGERGDDATPEPVTATIRQLREKFAGTTFPVTGDIVVSGRVTTSDYDENFYRTFCIEEDGAGIEVMAGIDHLHNDFPEGCQVTLRLRGLALGESHGVLQDSRERTAADGYLVVRKPGVAAYIGVDRRACVVRETLVSGPCPGRKVFRGVA